MDSDAVEQPVKRFKHQSYQASLKDVHLPSALVQSKYDHDIADNQSHFHEAIDQWRQLNLSPAFVKFAGQADGLSASLPLLLLHWRDVVDLWQQALDDADDEALRALLDLMQKLAHDLRSSLLPSYDTLLSRLLQLLPRAISAAALTALLATFSALFKYLLIPSAEAELFTQTWGAVRGTLPKCNSEVQRAMAEVWGSVLRRAKTAMRGHATECMAADLEGVEDACAWVVVFACKSVSQTLHTAAPSIVGPLVKYHLISTDPERTFTCIRRVLTALTHHCKSAEQFSSLSELLVNEVSLATAAGASEEGMKRVMDVVAAVISVRQGSRIPAKHLSAIATQLPTIALSPVVQDSLLHACAAVLVAGDMSLWMGAGRKVVEHSWQEAAFGMRLCGLLSDLQWGGWKLLELPYVVKLTPQLLESEPRGTLALLASLQKAKRLHDADRLWQQKIDEWVKGRLVGWSLTAENVEQLQHILHLSSILPSVTTALATIAEHMLMAEDVDDGFRNSPANSTWVLASCMHELSLRKPATWPKSIDLRMWTEKVLEKWYWSEAALESLVDLIGASSTQSEIFSFEAVYAHLAPSILSHSSRLRLSALLLLNSKVVKTSSAEQLVLGKAIQAEEVSLDVQGVRERVLRITRVDQVVTEGNSLSSELAVRWLVAQLKVNLKPVWVPAAQTVAAVAQRCGDVVWRVLLAELRGAIGVEAGSSASQPEWVKEASEEEEDRDTIREDEKTWRDPSAHKVRGALSSWLQSGSARQQLIRAQRSRDRFDRGSYESQLLAALKHCASLVEKHNRDVIPLFLDTAGPDGPAKLPRPKLSAWLTIFSNFTNPRVLYSSQTLHELYVALLSHPDRALQTLALSCLITYKSPHLVRHEDALRGLLDETRWRDELTNLDIANMGDEGRSELVDVVVRILFGFMRERKGRSRGADRRAAVLSALGGCTDEELNLLVELMLQPVLPQALDVSSGSFNILPVSDDASSKQQVGFLTLLEDVLKSLGSRLIARWDALLGTTISLIAHAQAKLSVEKVQDEPEAVEVEDADEQDAEDAEVAGSSGDQYRRIRQLGLKRFADFFRVPATFDFTPYVKVAFQTTISSRLATLDRENTQAPSALMNLFYAWTSSPEHAGFLVDFDERALPQVYACLVGAKVKPAVVSRILDIVDRLLALSSDDESISERIIRPHVTILLSCLATVVEHTKHDQAASNPLAKRQISILSGISHYLSDGAQASTLLTLFSPLLRKPAKLVGEDTKADILKIVSSLLPLVSDLADRSSPTSIKTFEMLSSLFQAVRSRKARVALLAAFETLSEVDVSLQPLAELLGRLNAYSTKRIEEPDFDRRLEAFSELNETFHKSLSASHWLPVLYNMLHFIQDANELAIRNSSSQGFKHFIENVAQNPASEYQDIFARKLFPALKNGLRSKNEMVRVEVLGVIAFSVARCDSVAALQDMKILLEGGDEEANFFNNIHHVQLHRRVRALRRLADHCDENQIRSSTLADIFVPLVGNFVVSSSDVDHQLVTAAITAIGHMARQLIWGRYFALVQRYMKLSKVKDASERIYIRTLVSILDNFHFPMTELVPVEPKEVDEDDVAVEDHDVDAGPAEVPVAKAAATDRVADAVNNRLLPALLRHLENRNEAEDSMRIPVAVGIVKVAQHLPETTKDAQITRLIIILSQALRSKNSETRDLTRETLAKIAVILGPSSLPTILREMRGALLRGPHLHVLAYVTHYLLVHVTSGEHAETFKNLDGCVTDVAHVSAEVIFGEPGKDVQSEGFKTKMREVRSSSSKGLDSFAIMARFISPPKISGLLLPLRAIMQETEALKIMSKVDEVLRRIASGFNSNELLNPSELLVLCHSLISQNSKFLQHVAKPLRKGKGRGKGNDYIVQLKKDLAAASDHYAVNSFRFIVFGLDLFNTAFRRSKFDFSDTNVIARLESMVAAIGNTLYSSNSHVLTQALKASAAIVKCPLKNVEKSLPVFIRQTIDIVKQTGSTESEVVQAAFKSLAVIVRDRSNAEVKEKDLVYLLELLTPDLEEPARQAAVFAMLRAIVARKFVVPEIYDSMDKVSEIMVTNQSSQVQELCRGVLLQFLLDYPQGKGRLRNQMTFLAKNLSYVYESGRKSVMELLSAIVLKFDGALISEYADMLFVALVMVIANDESAKCREMASEIVKNLFSRLDDAHRRVLMSHLHSWASQQDQPQLTRVACQVYGLVIDVLQKDAATYLPVILEDMRSNLSRSARQLEANEEADEDAMEVDLEWQLPYHVLTVLGKVLRVFPEVTSQPQKISWPDVVLHLLFPHAWARTAASRLLGSLFSVVPPALPQAEYPDTSPLAGLDLKDIANKLCLQLRSPHLDASLSLQVVKNLFYVGKCFCEVPAPASAEEQPDSDEEGDTDGEDVEGFEPVEEAEEDESSRRENPLAWLFSKLSYQARSAHIARRNRASSADNWYHQPSAILRWFAAMTSHMDAVRLETFLMHMLSPLYRITDDDTIRDPHMDELKTTAVELQELVQQKVGTTKFANTYNKIRQSVLGVQRERRTARVMKATTHPQAAAKRKLQRGFAKKESHKRKNSTFADNKGRLKRRRE
ncbi:hypothetical protein FA95DRAFT_1561038 [Auriscalpium vulgare]|uniref:Uncharacterized protein n=1 Tax=Auriscalpium vulgare TaxID=40419 RepID=A0ACB8RNT3_9AGAM|nr:hypothetical protein FA95DRAFT_1561038 [Auriscalpium vulgare]